MKTKSILLMISLMMAVSAIRAQNALPIQVNSFLDNLYALQSCSDSYNICTKQTDENGIVSVKDAGRLEEQLKKVEDDMKAVSMSQLTGGGSVPSTSSMPSQAQMQQAMNMQGMSPEQAMKMAQSMGHQPAAVPTYSAASMEEIGKVENAVQELNATFSEMSSKMLEIEKTQAAQMDKVQRVGTCPEYKVKGADLALSRCDCVKQRDLDFCNKRVQVENEYLMQLNALFQSYLPSIKGEIGTIDKAEKDFKYGESVSMPVIKTQLTGAQIQALGQAGHILSGIIDLVKESGQEYAGVVNVNNGHLSEACQ